MLVLAPVVVVSVLSPWFPGTFPITGAAADIGNVPGNQGLKTESTTNSGSKK